MFEKNETPSTISLLEQFTKRSFVMNKSQANCTTIGAFYQSKHVESKIFFGFDHLSLSPMAIIINHAIDYIDLSFFNQYYKANKIVGGRPNFNFKVLLKIFLFSLYQNIPLRQLRNNCAVGSNLHYLSCESKEFPSRQLISKFLNILDMHIDVIFTSILDFICLYVYLDTSILYCDGTPFEANNSRHKIITKTNIERSNKKWNNLINGANKNSEVVQLAQAKINLNILRIKKLNELNRDSYGKTDEDCVILQNKSKAFIAGYNVKLITENMHGLIVYACISNKNPDHAVFLDIVDDLINRCRPDKIVFDSGYGIVDILVKLRKHGVIPIVKAIKNKKSDKITDNCFRLSNDDNYLICPSEEKLHNIKVDGNIYSYKGSNCLNCNLKENCSPKTKNKRVDINLTEFKILKETEEIFNSEYGQKLYSKRSNKCESPYGFIKNNLNGEKLKMNGIIRNRTIMYCNSILYNLSRFISITCDIENNI